MTGTFIFVLDRGFVIVGEAALHEGVALFWRLRRSRTVRRWGTTEGLAELKDGPIPDKTQLDAVCERSLPFRSVIDIIHPTPKGKLAWKAALGG